MLKTRLLCSESGHSTQNFYVCEASTGSIVRFYNGSNIIAERTAAVIAGDYVVAAERSKPIVHFWSMDSQMPFLKSTVPGIISNLVVSRCGLFLIASIANKLYIWQTNSGNLLTVIDQHVQTITALTLTDDDCLVISGSKDGIVCVFELNYYLAARHNVSLRMQTFLNNLKPKYELSEHTAEITGVFVGCGGQHAYLLSISLDRTLKITSLKSGTVQLSVVFPYDPKVVTLKNTNDQAFCGLANGDIYPVNLYDPPRTRDFYIDDLNNQNKVVFKGHSATVICLQMLRDYQTLVSTADDKLMIFWDVLTGQKLKTIEKKFPVNNLIGDLTRNFANVEVQPTKFLKSLSKSIRNYSDKVEIDFMIDRRTNEMFDKKLAQKPDAIDDEISAENERLQNENKKLKRVNKKLYLSSLQTILKK